MGWDSWVFWKKAVIWDLRLDEASWDSNLGKASPVVCYRMCVRLCSQWVESWRRTNSQLSKNCVSLSLSSCVENLKVKKVIKVLYLNQESRQCFVFFGFLCVWTFYACERLTHPYICIMYFLHIRRLWLCYIHTCNFRINILHYMPT